MLLRETDANLLLVPRYASLPNIMKAKKKPIEKLEVSSTGVDLSPLLETLKITEPPKRSGGVKVVETIVRSVLID